MLKPRSLLPNKKIKSDDQQMLDCPLDMDNDVLQEIFKRLPVKTLGRFRCVCKLWNSIISSHFLIIHHHHHHQNSSIPITQKPSLLFRRWGYFFKVNSYAFYDPNEHGTFDPHTPLLTLLPFHHFPFRTRHQPQNQDLIFVDVIHGVVCLTLSLESPPIILFNPVIHNYVEIPNSPFEFDGYACSLGFGFNRMKDDFLLIRLCFPIHKPMPLVYEAFSAKQGLWRKAAVTRRKIQPFKVVSQASFFMNGTIHWIVSLPTYKVKKKRKHKYRLLMFDCELEELKSTELPPEFNWWGSQHPNRMKTIFLKCRGRLSLILYNQPSVQLWVMEEYGVASTWRRIDRDFDKLDGLFSEESMFLMDVKRQTTYNNEGKVYYETDGRTFK